MKTRIIVTTQFEALHCWPDCPFEDVKFLRHPHRHVFHATMKFPVNHNDRDREFILVKQNLDHFLMVNWSRKNLGSKSCEDLCLELLEKFPDAVFASVFEDNENGAEIINE